jgi:hypothetical protein
MLVVTEVQVAMERRSVNCLLLICLRCTACSSVQISYMGVKTGELALSRG